MLSVGSPEPGTLTPANTPKVRVGMVLDQPFPPDARVEREATALVEAGFEVHLLCMASADKAETEPPEEVYRGIHLHRVNPERVVFRVPLLGLETRLPYQGVVRNLFREVWNIDTAWHTLINRFVERLDIQILHIHDLRLVNTGLSVAGKRNIPLVVDLHENYPALMEMMKGRNNPERGRRQREKWEYIESQGVQGADHVITVIDEAKDRLIRKGVPPQKILVLPNTVEAAKFESAPIDSEVIRQFKTNFLMTYVGHINDRHRGIHTVIEAMGLLKDEIPELAFVGAGAVREPYMAQLQPLIDQYGLQERVHFSGWLDETQFVSYIEAADICLCPHLAGDHTNATFPNKLYLYHLFRKPVIASNCAPIHRYIAETEGGLVFPSGDAHALAERIRELYRDAGLRRTLGASGQKAVRERHNWQQTATGLVELYQALALPLVQAQKQE